jgi:uncharacterized protein YdhG (YjbR/CyaY superfamily)
MLGAETIAEAVEMTKSKFESVDEYIASQPEASRPILERVRSVIRKALPNAKERISYQIPAYEQGGACIIYFAGWKKHFSLYPISERLLEELGLDASDYEVNDKGTIRFPLSEPVPEKLIVRIVKLRAQQEEQRLHEKPETRRPTEKKAAKKAAKRPSAQPQPTKPAAKREPAKKAAKKTVTRPSVKSQPTKEVAKRKSAKKAVKRQPHG